MWLLLSLYNLNLVDNRKRLLMTSKSLFSYNNHNHYLVSMLEGILSQIFGCNKKGCWLWLLYSLMLSWLVLSLLFDLMRWFQSWFRFQD